jgi:hypothetical protein
MLVTQESEMSKRTRKTPRQGDVLEFDTANGRAYLQYTHDDAVHGPLLRVLPGRFTKRPDSFARLVREPELYFVFAPIRYAVRKGLVTIAAYEHEIPERVRPFPLMRWAGLTDRGGRPQFWILYDGVERARVERLSEGQRTLSIVEIPSYPDLLDRLESGWLPLTDTAYKV